MMEFLRDALQNAGGKPLPVDLFLTHSKSFVSRQLVAFDDKGAVFLNDGQDVTHDLIPWTSIDVLSV